MTYRKDHIAKGTAHNRRPGIAMAATTITIHNTGNPSSTAANERAWLTNPSNNRTASYHIVVDDKEAIECLPLNESAWHAGDGSRAKSGNRTSIGVEICERNYSQSLDNAVKLVAAMLKERGWGIDRLRRHWDWSGKVCPRLMYDSGKWTGWIEFKNRVAAELDGEGDEDKLILSNYQWGVVEDNVKKLLDRKVITDQNWLQKAENRTLTASELAWLTFVIASK
ncbi:peptidoglycan recognition protein family protein [Paenibacillus senegalimassiliensis]|uniref:peptidoglycan recognition protein family protein n=1 Tax=Paenibacillus senegalimassiliensis TaxID=1737426 RepID=UPI0009EC698C|nr:N-acetylmuramoyl-L-alanine amidase [Paenibacillus senegalimassiliensis]